MNWESLLSLKRYGDNNKRLRVEQDDLRLGFEVDYDRIVFSNAFRSGDTGFSSFVVIIKIES